VSKGNVVAFLGAVMALALLAAGCGGGDDTTSSMTKAQFVKQANAICKVQNQKRGEAIKKVIASHDPKKLLPQKDREELVLDTLPAYAAVPKQLGTLEAPAGDQEKVDAIIKAMEEAAKDVEANPAGALTSTKQFLKADEPSSQYGLTDCVV